MKIVEIIEKSIEKLLKINYKTIQNKKKKHFDDINILKIYLYL